MTLNSQARAADPSTTNLNSAEALVNDRLLKSRRWVPGWLRRQGTWPLCFAIDIVAMSVVAVSLRAVNWRMLCFGTLVLVLLTMFGLYRSRLSMSALDDFPRIATAVLVATPLTLAFTAVLDRRADELMVDNGLLWIAASVLFALTLSRAVSYGIIRRFRSRGVAHRTVIVGAGRVGSAVAQMLRDHREYGLVPIGFVDADPLVSHPELPVLGDQANLPNILSRNQVSAVIIAFALPREVTMIDMIRSCDRMNCEIFVVPRLFEVHHVSDDMDYIWGMPLTRLRRGAHRAVSWKLKRLVDIVVSSFALVLLSPLMAVIALGVRLEGGPGVLFRQDRIGIDGRQFKLLKFRSLRPVDEQESQTTWNVSHDSRLGPIGKLIRKTSLDELPQLINISRGDMSIVGPRPERPHFVEQFRQTYPHYFARHRVPCGLTGWAQVHGLRGDTSIGDRARLDNYYVENWSLWLDTKIILRTMTSVITRSGS